MLSRCDGSCGVTLCVSNAADGVVGARPVVCVDLH